MTSGRFVQNSPASAEFFFSKHAIASVPWIVASKVFTFVLYFIISIVIVRGLGPAQYGIYSLLNGLAENLAVLCAFGLNIALLRYVPELVQHHNRMGLVRLLTRAAGVEMLILALIGIVLYLAQDLVTKFLHFEFALFFLPTLALTGMLTAKDYLNNVFTALFRARTLALTSTLQAALFLLYLWMGAPLSVKHVLLSCSSSIAAISLFGLSLLVLFMMRWKAHSSGAGIGRKRLLTLSLPTLANALTNKFLQQYSEIFFLGYFATAQVVGQYALGYMLANLLLTFIPLALHALFTSAFAESYAKHQDSLGALIAGMYQILTIVCLPLSCLGVFFAPQAVIVIYGEKMASAGYIAAYFCLFQALTLLWVPLSMALIASEKVAKTTWLNLLQLLVNLLLDYFFIKHYGVPGALIAVTATFFITAPIKLWIIRGLLGGLYFPWSFALRTTTPAVVLAALLYLLLPSPSLPVLALMAVLYLGAWALILKLLHLVRPPDTERFRAIGIPQFNRVLDFFTS